MTDYGTGNNGSNYEQSGSSSYAPSTTDSNKSSYGAPKPAKSGSSLYVINNEVKEKKMGICTCNKVGNCRGTCAV